MSTQWRVSVYLPCVSDGVAHITRVYSGEFATETAANAYEHVARAMAGCVGTCVLYRPCNANPTSWLRHKCWVPDVTALYPYFESGES